MLLDARRRFEEIASALVASSEGAALRTGFAELTGDEGAAALIARADGRLLDSRHDTDEPSRAQR